MTPQKISAGVTDVIETEDLLRFCVPALAVCPTLTGLALPAFVGLLLGLR